MKTLLLSADDIQNFNKLVYDPKKVVHLTANITDSGGGGVQAASAAAAASCNLMALQYYLKQPNKYAAAQQQQQQQQQTQQQQQQQQQSQQQQPQLQQQQQHSTTQVVINGNATHAHHQLLAQSQSQLKQLQLKQPAIHHQQHTSNYHHHHHHPYYQQSSALAAAHTLALPPHSHSHNHSHSHSHATHAHAHTHAHSHSHTHNPNHALSIHALNQNSNFSAASSSTGASGTISSHAPTQQSNTTGSSLSPPSGVTTNTRNHTTVVNNAIVSSNSGSGANSSSSSASSSCASANTAAHQPQQPVRNSLSNGAKKLKTEPILSQYHQTERLDFANTHMSWNEDQWKRVVFQDERKFNLDGPDGFSYYFHDLRNYERTLSQRPRGNSVYVYLLITAGGPIHLEVEPSKLKPETCIETILRERANIVAKLGGSGNTDFVLQDHNWVANTLPRAQEWLSTEGIKLQKWPTIAHDLNIMENIWGWLIREVFDGGRKFSRKDDLIFRIREVWGRLPFDLITNLYSTLPERMMELFYTRGIYTNC